MAVEIRPATAGEMSEFPHVWATGLGLPGDRTHLKDPEQTLCAFENGKMTSTSRALPFTVYFDGKDVPAAGIADVSTLPEYRRRGVGNLVINDQNHGGFMFGIAALRNAGFPYRASELLLMFIRPFCYRQSEKNRRPRSFDALNPYRSAVEFDNGF